jgi:hypothetical protein
MLTKLIPQHVHRQLNLPFHPIGHDEFLALKGELLAGFYL